MSDIPADEVIPEYAEFVTSKVRVQVRRFGRQAELLLSSYEAALEGKVVRIVSSRGDVEMRLCK